MFSNTCLIFVLVFCSQASNSYHVLDLLQKSKLRAEYLGGWAIGLPGGTTCPDFAPNACPYTSGFGGQACCPLHQWCFGDTISAWYCCPTNEDCSSAVQSVPVCAQEGWNMFSLDWFSECMCCPAGQKALLTSRGLGEEGLCVPQDQPAPQSLIAKSAAQNGVGPAPIIESTTILAAPSTSQIVVTQTAPTFSIQPTATGNDPLTFATVAATTVASISVASTTIVNNNPVTFTTTTPTATASPTAVPSPGPSLSKVVPGSIIGGLCLAALLYFLYNYFCQCSQGQGCCPSLSFTRDGGNGSGSGPVYGGQTNINNQHTGSMQVPIGNSRTQQNEIELLPPPTYKQCLQD